jgi:XTP/dITP diphosphohydrolase
MIVVLVDPRRPSLVPVEAVTHLSGEVQYTEEIPAAVVRSLPGARPVQYGDGGSIHAPVLLSSDPGHRAVTERLTAGATLISAPGPPRGERLVDAVAMMDTLRTAGPWESEQTHDSLRRFLVEETYELLDALRGGDPGHVREELGDVLLQVLFHARIAEDAARPRSFSIDDVAVTLMDKLSNRAPDILAGQMLSLDEQLARWEQRKAAEKPRTSVMDDVDTGQPALALAQKVVARATKAGLPVDLIPIAVTSVSVSAGPDNDPESSLRAAVLEFVDTVRATESEIAATRLGCGTGDGDPFPPGPFPLGPLPLGPFPLGPFPLGDVSDVEWRAHWPSG